MEVNGSIITRLRARKDCRPDVRKILKEMRRIVRLDIAPWLRGVGDEASGSVMADIQEMDLDEKVAEAEFFVSYRSLVNNASELYTMLMPPAIFKALWLQPQMPSNLSPPEGELSRIPATPIAPSNNVGEEASSSSCHASSSLLNSGMCMCVCFHCLH